MLWWMATCVRTGGHKVDPAFTSCCSVRDSQISRWPFQKSRWITARAKKHACEREYDLPVPAPGSNNEDYGAQAGLDATNCAFFSSSYKKSNARGQDESLERLLHCRFDEGDMQHLLPMSDILEGLNTPLTLAHGSVTSNIRCGRATVDSLVHTRMYASDAPTRDAALQSRSREDCNARVQRDSWFGPPSAGHEFIEYPVRSSNCSLSFGPGNSDVSFAGTRDKFSDRPPLPPLEAPASSVLRQCSRPEPNSAEFFELGYTDCDLSYLVGSSMHID